MTKDPAKTVRRKAQAARRARSELRDAILEARGAGLTLPQIGEAAQLSKQRIHQILKEEGSTDAS